MKNLKLLAALLALAIGLAGCGNGSSTPSSKPENRLDGDNMIASNTQRPALPPEVRPGRA